jgi:2-dehydro-3-deoxyglucarate aldolase
MSLKQKLSSNQLTFGSWITIGHESIAEIMCTGGFDWLAIDMEHSVIELATAQNLIGHIHSKGVAALARVGKNEEVIIKRVMDAGADGVIVPMINTRQDAELAVSYVKYPPQGKRGVGLARAQGYGIGFDKYKDWLNKESIIIAQIEHILAINNINEIISVEGIDGIIIGPYDLSGSMGFPGEYERAEVKNALKKVEEACKRKNIPLGFHVIQPDHQKAKEKIDAGYTFIGFSIDFFFLGNKIREEMQRLNSLCKQ